MKKFVIILLTIIMAFGSLTLISCQKDDGKKEILTVADFEQWAPDFQLLRVFNNFGKVSRNEDANYVLNGKYSAKVQPLGGYLSKSKPVMYFTSTSNLFDFDYKDFSYFDEVVANVYNANDTVKEVEIGLVSSIGGAREISLAPGMKVSLNPNEWTRIDYWLDLDLLSLSADISDICGIYLQFENTGLIELEDAPIFYVDDIKLVKAESKREANNLIQLDDGEVCDFEKPYQAYIAQSDLSGPEATTFTLKVVKTADYGITASSGEKALLCQRHSAQSAGTKYSRILLPEALMNKTKMTSVNTENTTQLKSTYFCFDVYNDSPDDYWSGKGSNGYFYISSWFTYAGGKGLKAPLRIITDTNKNNYGEFDPNVPGIGAKYGEWTTYKISLYEIINGGCTENHVKTPGYFAILISAFVGDEDRLLFFDNFRIETGDPVYVKEK